MKWQKRTDAELFKELRANTFGLGLIAIAIAITGLIWKGLEEIFYGFMLWLIGFLLISYSGQKYLQEHPKTRMIIMYVLIGLLVLGVVLFLIFNK